MRRLLFVRLPLQKLILGHGPPMDTIQNITNILKVTGQENTRTVQCTHDTISI